MAAKILVSGATGAVGRVLIKDLVRRGHDVRAGVYNQDKTSYIKMTGVEPVSLDYGDFFTIDRSLQGINTLFLITPFAREQVEYSKRMIDRALLFGIQHLVYISIIGAEEVPGTRFSRWHRRIEKYIESSGIPYTILRPNMYMQNFLRFLQPSGGFIYMPLNGGKVSYIDVRDVAGVASEVIVANHDHQGKTYEITGSMALSLDDVASILTSQVGTHISYINISEETARHVMLSLGTPGWMADGMLEIYSAQRLNLHQRVSPVVLELTGNEPVSFEKFAHDYANVFKAIVQHEHHTYLS